MIATVEQHFGWPGITSMIDGYVKKCPIYQTTKITSQSKYGLLPIDNRNRKEPWNTVHIDLIGPWNVGLKNPDGKIQNIILMPCRALIWLLATANS